MDVDNDNLYDEISSFLPTPGDYTSDDLDELIRSTDSQLDASLDLNLFSKSLEHQNDYDMEGSDDLLPNSMPLITDTSVPSNVFNFNFSAFPSPATSHQSSGSSADYNSSLYETSERTSSTSSLNGDYFNPDDFINFLNDDDVKIESAELTQDRHHFHHHNERNTPSPTGSCTSSSGSSTTSGVQSDISSVVSLPPQNGNKAYSSAEEQDELSEFIKFKMSPTESSRDSGSAVMDINENQKEVQFRMPAIPNDHCNSESSASAISGGGLVEATFVPINLPGPITMTTFQPAIQTVNVMQSSLIPIQTVQPMDSPSGQASTSLENKNENVTLQHQQQKQQQPLIKPIGKTNSNKVTNSPAAPTNAKPKTIFLSSNDFKALMQKMNNTNGNGAATGATALSNGSRRNSLQNGQMPKIIMKTASGKYITANKMPAGVGNSSPAQQQQNSQPIPAKLFKPSTVKQQHPSKVVYSNNNNTSSNNEGRTTSAIAAAAAAAARAQQLKNSRTDFSMTMKGGGLSEEKLIKKQLRMLKNRESASLSRKKKKEYVERLEQRISNLEKENYSLKGENASLRSQLMAFAKTCDCKHRNVSEFILNTLSMNENRHHGHENSTVLDDLDASFLIEEDDSSDHSDRCDNYTTSHNVSTANSSASRPTSRHVRIAPKTLNGSSSSIHRNFKHRMTASNVKKNVAVLFAMAFMVTLNVGNFQSYLNKSALENALEASATPNENAEQVVGGGEATSGTGRRLLWVPNEHEFQEQNNRSKREADFHNMPPPPLHFLRPANRTMTEELNGTTTKDEPPILKPLKYGPTTFGNGTTNYAHENNMRLARNLHKWIGGNDYLNLTDSGMGLGARMAQFAQFGKASGGQYEDYNNIPIGVKQKRKIFYGTEGGDDVEGVAKEKQKKYDIGEGQNSLGLFKPRISEEYLRLFRGIKRQDDTFYVLSFNLDHILLPASAYNKSARPKMSLMLPAGDPSLNGDIVLMQIDCEVLNTTEIELKSHMIPEKLRPSMKFGPSNVRVHPNDVANNETKNSEAAGSTKASHGGEIHLKREEDSKEKPRTYFMMGPKNHPSTGIVKPTLSGETIIKKRPTIVKLNANDSVIGSGIMNVRNSSLFTRMKDTVVNSNGLAANGFVATASTASDVRKLL